MTQATPPGWYPDPGRTNDGPPTERWWDGAAWTERTRPIGAADPWAPPATPPQPAAPEWQGTAQQPRQDGTPHPAHPAHPAYPSGSAGGPPYPYGYGYPGQPPQPGGGPRRGLRTGIAIAVTAAVLASIGVGVWALAGNGGGDHRPEARQSQGQDGRGGQGRRGGDGGPDGQPDPGGSAAPEVKGGGTLPDRLDGISLPVPKGWTGSPMSVGAQLTSDDTYACPGDTKNKCTPGGLSSAPALALGTKGSTPEAVAKADISANAEQSYGGSTYGGITSHEVAASRAVTVAGQKGYLVRWKAVTRKGADGWVQSVAFPSPTKPQLIVVLRFGIDVGHPTSVIDDVLKGVKPYTGGDGTGQNV
ncbi:DUF2510 domain-containing protein [Streptomyces sp. J2-1]|uniref:DUF2510 domain-containing protein n=1 Tax=Streptomyces corallincola TaxID=2851888 RepID=UPI001C39229E|nr:DUF2510 domain-containing protein [Streptomyces corallincola]MBV2355345.1 DUF2510 domain-containing protein [Streptomyces corallincola]